MNQYKNNDSLRNKASNLIIHDSYRKIELKVIVIKSEGRVLAIYVYKLKITKLGFNLLETKNNSGCTTICNCFQILFVASK